MLYDSLSHVAGCQQSIDSYFAPTVKRVVTSSERDGIVSDINVTNASVSSAMNTLEV